MSEREDIIPDIYNSTLFEGVGDFFDQHKKPLLQEYRSNNQEQDGFHVVFGGIRITYGDFVKGSQISAYKKRKRGFVQLRIALHQTDSFVIDHIKYYLNEQEYNLVYFTAEEDTADNYQACENAIGLLKIDLQLDLFFKYCPPIKSSFELFRKEVQQNRSVVLSTVGLSVSNEMRSVIFDIIYCNKAHHFRHIYLKAKVVELLTLQLEYCDHMQRIVNPNVLKEEETQRILHVKQLLDEQFYLDHTLLSLARAVGTNDATLKKHFKQAFGMTVFSYLTKVRMQNARKLLMDGKDKIQVIAGKVGYKYATHFTAAFKKYFGYLPTKIRLAWVPLFLDISTAVTEVASPLSV